MTPADVFFGGTFDPPHLGHLIIASEVVSTLGAERLLFVPAAQNPFKEHGPMASGSDRLKMIQVMTNGDSRLSVHSFEIDRPGPSRTYDTIESLIRDGTLIDDPWMVIGDELLPDVTRWYRGQELLRRVRLAVVRRGAPETSGSGEKRLEVLHQQGRLAYVNNPFIGISSRDIRTRLREGRSIKYLVTDDVYDYIRQFSLYLQ